MDEMDRNLKGALWKDNEAEILWKGEITIDGRKKYASIQKSVKQNGDPVCELVVSVGLVYENYLKPQGKTSPTQPDIGGPVTIDGSVYQFGSWFNKSAKGNDYLGVQLRPKNQGKDDIPF